MKVEAKWQAMRTAKWQTLSDYNRRWDAIMRAYRCGALSPALAKAAIADLTARGIRHTPPTRPRQAAVKR